MNRVLEGQIGLRNAVVGLDVASALLDCFRRINSLDAGPSLYSARGAHIELPPRIPYDWGPRCLACSIAMSLT